MSAPHLAPDPAADSQRRALALRIERASSRVLFRRHRNASELLERRIAELGARGVDFVDLTGLQTATAKPRVLLAADLRLPGLRTEIVPLLRRESIPLCLLLDPNAPASVVSDLERSLERADEALRFELAMLGQPSFENGSLPAERVYARLVSLRRERERALQRPCSAYFAATRRLGPAAEDLILRCGFEIVFGQKNRPPGGLWPSESLWSFRPDRWQV